MTPSVSFNTKLDFGAITNLVKSEKAAPVLQRIGEVAAAAMGARIRQLQATAYGEKLDENTEFTLDLKAEQGLVLSPLIATNAMTEPNAWQVTIDAEKGTVTLRLDSAHHHKWDNIMDIAEKTNRNWVYT